VKGSRGQLQLAHGGFLQCLAGIIQREVYANLLKSHCNIFSEISTWNPLELVLLICIHLRHLLADTSSTFEIYSFWKCQS